MKVFQSSEFLPHEISGDLKSKNMVLFWHGWPDTCRMWDNLIPKLPDCLILNVSYPGHFNKTSENVSHQEIIKRMHNTINFYDSNHEKNRIIVAHDWGALYTYFYDNKYPKSFDHLVTLDVSPFKPDNSFKGDLLILLYQWSLIFAYILYRTLPFLGFLIGKFYDTINQFKGNFITHQWAKLFQCDNPSVSVTMNYHYMNLWKAILTRNLPITKDYKPSVDIQYFYGKNKPMQFQNEKWLQVVSNTQNSSYQVLNCGHWISLKFPDLVLNAIKSKFIPLPKY